MSIRSRLEDRGLGHWWKKVDQITKLYYFTDELVLRGVIRERDHHEYWGKFYEIPECCIQFYVGLHEQDIENPAKYMWESVDERYHTSLMPYVPCPECFKKEVES